VRIAVLIAEHNLRKGQTCTITKFNPHLDFPSTYLRHFIAVLTQLFRSMPSHYDCPSHFSQPSSLRLDSHTRPPHFPLPSRSFHPPQYIYSTPAEFCSINHPSTEKCFRHLTAWCQLVNTSCHILLMALLYDGTVRKSPIRVMVLPVNLPAILKYERCQVICLQDLL
jgi:hypothetical protein